MTNEYSGGLVLLDKPNNITSFNALYPIKKSLKNKKVGHTGTLDKFAHGLLCVLVQKYTKLAPIFTEQRKEYKATFEFGKETDTLDTYGETMKLGERIPEKEEIEKLLPNFIGNIQQKPPIYSAIHVKGERAWRKAKRGESFTLKPRNVHIYNIFLQDYNPPFCTLVINCSKGTYIRALARDFGKVLDTCAYVTDLQRTKIGNLSIDMAIKPSCFNPEKNLYDINELKDKIEGVSCLYIKENYKNRFLNGAPIKHFYFQTSPQKEGKYFVFDNTDQLFACMEKKGQDLRYICVFT